MLNAVLATKFWIDGCLGSDFWVLPRLLLRLREYVEVTSESRAVGDPRPLKLESSASSGGAFSGVSPKLL